LSDDLSVVTVNEKKDHHDCEMTFSFYYNNDKSDFKVDEDQLYKIHTTIKEVELLNEALNVYQADDFKERCLLYMAEADESQSYPEFSGDYIDAQQLAKALKALAKDEDSLIQLSEYCLETAPTYADDFGINKQIRSLSIDGVAKDINGYDDLKDYLSVLKK